MSFFKRKIVYIPFIIVVLASGFWYRQYKKNHQPPVYETVRVERGDIIQTVEATGKIESTNNVSLRFEAPGTIASILIKEGDTVKAGALLGNIRLGELDAVVAQAKANLNQKLIGPSEQDKKYYAAAVLSAKASWEQAKVDANSMVKVAQAALETAKNNLKLAEGGDKSQIVNQAYANAVTTFQGTLVKLDDALTQADNILGIDNIFANDSFESYLSTLNASKLSVANGDYLIARQAGQKAREAILPLTLTSDHAKIDIAFVSTEDALVKMNTLLGSVSDVLKATQAIGTLTPSSLNDKKTIIETTRSTISGQYNTVLTQKQSLADAQNSFSTYSIAYTKALQDLEQAKANALTSTQIKEAAYNQAEATFESKVNPPREVDVAALRAALASAVAARDKGVIQAPFDGVITKINKKVGEAVSAADVILEMLSPHFEIKVDIPETDVAKLFVSTNKQVEFTVDALGDEKKFQGQITAIDKAATEIQDVVYYQVHVAVASSTLEQPFKAGMTANVKIKTDSRQNVLFIPLRIVRTRSNGTKYVKTLSNSTEQEVPVKLGLKGDDNKVEILEGLKEKDEVIVSVKK